jgi:hypothetical protein
MIRSVRHLGALAGVLGSSVGQLEQQAFGHQPVELPTRHADALVSITSGLISPGLTIDLGLGVDLDLGTGVEQIAQLKPQFRRDSLGRG